MGVHPLYTMSLCSGFGLADRAIELALPAARTVLYVEVEAFAIANLVHQMEEGQISRAPVFTDLVQLRAGEFNRRLVAATGHGIGLVHGGFPCFVAGTLILSERGYVPIESLAVGDRVLTHQGRWRAITATMVREGAQLRRVRGQGVDLVTTDEHPFYTRRKYLEWVSRPKPHERRWDPPAWTESKDLTRDHFLGQVLPPVEPDEHSPDFWWLVGRYLADGWLVERPGRVDRARTVICCDRPESDELAERIKRAGFHATKASEATVDKFHITQVSLGQFLRCFGRLAHGKRLPGFVFTLDVERSRALLDGYLSGDGHDDQDGRHATTVSEQLAYGVALLAQRAYGIVASINRCPMRAKTTIEGRVVNQRDFFQVNFPPRNREAIIDGEYGWKPCRYTDPAGTGVVYNISVDEDESYIANGAIVHNCQGNSVAGKRAGIHDERWLWPHIARILKEVDPPYCVFENVPGLTSVNDGEALHEILSDLASLGWDTEYGLFRASDVGASHRRERWFLVGRNRAVVDAEGRGHPSFESLIDWQRPVVGSESGADGRIAARAGAEGVRLGGAADAASRADLRLGSPVAEPDLAASLWLDFGPGRRVADAECAERGAGQQGRGRADEGVDGSRQEADRPGLAGPALGGRGLLGEHPSLGRRKGGAEHAGVEGRPDAAVPGGRNGRGAVADGLRDGEHRRLGQAGPGRGDGPDGDQMGRGRLADAGHGQSQERQGTDLVGGERATLGRRQLQPAGSGAGLGAACGPAAGRDGGDQAAAQDAGADLTASALAVGGRGLADAGDAGLPLGRSLAGDVHQELPSTERDGDLLDGEPAGRGPLADGGGPGRQQVSRGSYGDEVTDGGRRAEEGDQPAGLLESVGRGTDGASGDAARDLGYSLGGGGERRGIARDLETTTGSSQAALLQREWRRRAADDPGPGALPLFPPGPRSLRWCAIAYYRPDLFPALTPDGRIPETSPFYPFYLAGLRARSVEPIVHHVADGGDRLGGPGAPLPHDCGCPRTELLRGAGNGVVPHQECLALLILASRLGWPSLDSESEEEVQLGLAVTS